ncbi:23S rRNA (uridine(2552)-2'-O)-methyltransferase [Halalkalicoccus jeotgali]|uniref:Ribosomal RNA large subunit methyltransferase E n=1 Tax=Halalkalicoccus jeotgali (strain DSM 18796 / CECT 7217 / JCM 14584 / KCTC 4019 / B3) TaxID=795797 RepID=D8J5Y9_HALJB|nr:23S rRNA (uridine(2552)-2'-O)-methyltransferase [Halalkalicoccus jeotgali]ADJ13795.1 ribosomal RNA large subunit methyltransferase J [Halalkalicoccus jeotgali B3]ELY34159.1 23S rRNA methyltransferase J [Halalkalicoccus jeotgali B3]
MAGKDEYYNKAKQQGYRSRAAYKLQQLDEMEDLLSHGDRVVDLGAAPGGWLQVASERVGTGTVIGVDLQRIDSLEGVETIKGDMTDEGTRGEIIERIGEADTVLSDMAPNMTGEYSLDQARSVHLARQAFETAREILTPGGDLVVKVFEGRDLDALRDDMEAEFEYVRTTSPAASREESSEVYLIAKGFLTAPVEAGQRLTVGIKDVGSEGDGIAKVEGFTVFVPDAGEDESAEIEIEEVKPNFAFAKRLD